MSRDEMRAGDADRQAVVERLKTALEEGRLDLHEYDERLQQTYAAKTFRELDGVVTDLPGPIPAQQSRVQPFQPPAAPQPAAGVGETPRSGVRPFLASYGGVVLVCFLIWGLSCLGSREFVYPWPLWMLIPLILGLLRRWGGRNR
ncbi:hypothetical protein GCM10020358_03250 [Amorphoplanes nipponensis]|uniref:DUF1707 domain-containing protein n=1 Tax=Actinoplanes nipponensis TaxID=135950 RepID=A0A919JW23_9ACTN|nr:DUF1707 domain-containing protein [Actinoplanes nipponensis]GIE54054.1 hypothetical protein Ani05nite_75880 [Actinoplanes nipponensis]